MTRPIMLMTKIDNTTKIEMIKPHCIASGSFSTAFTVVSMIGLTTFTVSGFKSSYRDNMQIAFEIYWNTKVAEMTRKPFATT